jgi:hypothetical protein
MVSAPRSWVVAATGVGARLGTHGPASSGHPRCRERATCAPDPGRCEPPDGRWGHSNEPGYGPTSRVIRNSRADRIREGKKRLCCVTTRRRVLWILSSLGDGLGALAARALGLGVLGFALGVLATTGLPPCGLPAADLAQALGILAVTLVPAPRLVLAPAPFAQANSRARSARSGPRTGLSRNLVRAQRRLNLPRESPGRMRERSPRALSKREQDDYTSVKSLTGNKTENKMALNLRFGKRHQDPHPLGWRSADAQERR